MTLRKWVTIRTFSYLLIHPRIVQTKEVTAKCHCWQHRWKNPIGLLDSNHTWFRSRNKMRTFNNEWLQLNRSMPRGEIFNWKMCVIGHFIQRRSSSTAQSWTNAMKCSMWKNIRTCLILCIQRKSRNRMRSSPNSSPSKVRSLVGNLRRTSWKTNNLLSSSMLNSRKLSENLRVAPTLV